MSDASTKGFDVAPGSDKPALNAPSILLAVFVIGTCGLIYELMAGTLASYVLGDSVTQFSTIIGVYLFAMGVGAWLSGFVDKNVVARFIEVEIAVALVGGTSAAVLFLSFSRARFFHGVLYSVVLLIGVLVGLEIPLLMRILKDRYRLKDLVSRVLTADYLGALLAALAFPLFLVPRLGLVRGAFFVGCLNSVVAYWSTHLLSSAFTRKRYLFFLRAESACCFALLVVGMVLSDKLTSLAEENLYQDPIVFAKTSSYQRIVVSQGRRSFQLYINGNLQLSSSDEYRYHEALVHPVMAVPRSLGGRGPGRILVLGGGDGLAVREVLRHPDVETVHVVDLDPMVTDLGREFVPLRRQNEGSLHDPRVHIHNQDAMNWLVGSFERGERWDVIIADFPDPNSYSLGKLYTTGFYHRVRRVLSEHGALVVQATSPMFARRSFWCVSQTMEAAGFFVRPYHASVPSFGEWGYLLAAHTPFPVPDKLPQAPLRFLSEPVLAGLFVFPADMAQVSVGINRLNNQRLVRLYEDEWSDWN